MSAIGRRDGITIHASIDITVIQDSILRLNHLEYKFYFRENSHTRYYEFEMSHIGKPLHMNINHWDVMKGTII